MFVLFPTFHMASVCQITPEFLANHGIKGLVLDVDNTLTTHDSPIPKPEITQWLAVMKEKNIPMMIVSNNSSERVEPFARILGLPFVAQGKKPLKRGIAEAARALHLHSHQLCVVGDQLFTDVWGGNRFGAATILVQPIGPETMTFIKFKRGVEKRILRFDKRVNKKTRK